jgi:hypothetical protein
MFDELPALRAEVRDALWMLIYQSEYNQSSSAVAN